MTSRLATLSWASQRRCPFGLSTLRPGQVVVASPEHFFRQAHYKELKMSETDQDAREHLLKMRAMVRQLELQGLKVSEEEQVIILCMDT